MRQIGIAHHGADPCAAIGPGCDAVKAGQTGQVDQPGRLQRAGFHRINEVGPAAKPGRISGPGRQSLFNRGGADILEQVHADFPARLAAMRWVASRTAFVMPTEAEQRQRLPLIP